MCDCLKKEKNGADAFFLFTSSPHFSRVQQSANDNAGGFTFCF